MLPNQFVILWDDQPVGLDTGSGGYPYKTSYAGSVKYWGTRDEAEKYLDVFSGPYNASYGFQAPRAVIKEIQFKVVDA